MTTTPLVSTILTTKNRPRFLAIALRCFAHQTYPHRELVVVDDGFEVPADEDAIKRVGGRLIRLEQDTPLGTKTNIGVEATTGPLCQKMDDDDWYGPNYLETMIAAFMSAQDDAFRPTMTFATPFLFFEIGPWAVRRSLDRNVPGATLIFDRESWNERPLRNLRRDEDVWFFYDHLRLGVNPVAVDIGTEYLAVRHRGVGTERGHTWTHQVGTETLEEYLLDRPLHATTPESFLPGWALDAYRKIHEQARQR